MVKGPSGLPPVDRLLQFLVDSSGDGLEVVHCANCDLECSKQAGAPGGRRGCQVPGSQCWQSVPNVSPGDDPSGFLQHLLKSPWIPNMGPILQVGELKSRTSDLCEEPDSGRG